MDLVKIEPLTDNQRLFFENVNNYDVISLTGCPGTGKMFIAIHHALSEVKSRFVRQVKIIRSAVPTREIGFIKGDYNDKTRHYEQPYIDICENLLKSETYFQLKEEAVIDFQTTSFLRGLTFDNCVVIVDESANLDFHELETVITRMGENSQLILCGDAQQADESPEGLTTFLAVLNKMECHLNIDFNIEDVVRSGLVKDYLTAKYFSEDTK